MIDFTKKPIFGMVHLAGIHARAIDEIYCYIENGLAGAIVENYHGGDDDVESVMAILSVEKIPNDFKIGVNILPNDYRRAIELTDCYKGDFIQLDHIAGEYGNKKASVTMDSRIDHYNRCRENAPHVQVLGGVHPKYYNPITGSDLMADLTMAIQRADAIVVTGAGTGMATPLDKIIDFRTKLDILSPVRRVPLIIGAGLNPSNVKEQMQYADGAIVGSTFKPNGNTIKEVDPILVKEFMSAL